MPPRIPAKERSTPSSFQSEAQVLEARARRILFAKARAGHEDSLACLRDEYGIETLVLGGVTLIKGRVLVGCKVPS